MSALPARAQYAKIGEFISGHARFISVFKPLWKDILLMEKAPTAQEKMTVLATRIVDIEDRPATLDDVLNMYPEDIKKIFDMVASEV